MLATRSIKDKFGVVQNILGDRSNFIDCSGYLELAFLLKNLYMSDQHLFDYPSITSYIPCSERFPFDKKSPTNLITSSSRDPIIFGVDKYSIKKNSVMVASNQIVSCPTNFKNGNTISFDLGMLPKDSSFTKVILLSSRAEWTNYLETSKNSLPFSYWFPLIFGTMENILAGGNFFPTQVSFTMPRSVNYQCALVTKSSFLTLTALKFPEVFAGDFCVNFWFLISSNNGVCTLLEIFQNSSSVVSIRVDAKSKLLLVNGKSVNTMSIEFKFLNMITINFTSSSKTISYAINGGIPFESVDCGIFNSIRIGGANSQNFSCANLQILPRNISTAADMSVLLSFRNVYKRVASFSTESSKIQFNSSTGEVVSVNDKFSSSSSWQNFTLANIQSTIKIYCDGILTGSTYDIGCVFDEIRVSGNGVCISDILVYNRVLSDMEIMNLVNKSYNLNFIETTSSSTPPNIPKTLISMSEAFNYISECKRISYSKRGMVLDFANSLKSTSADVSYDDILIRDQSGEGILGVAVGAWPINLRISADADIRVYANKQLIASESSLKFNFVLTKLNYISEIYICVNNINSFSSFLKIYLQIKA